MKIAVAIALYNGEKFVRKQLESLLEQTRLPDEVVLCDDGSKDRTVQVAEDFIRENSLESSWHLILNGENLGYVRNFYKAISLCDADLVFLCDQDDVWHPRKIEKMAQTMAENENVSLLSCRYGMIDANGKRIHSLLHREKAESEAVIPVPFRSLAVSYRWPGMTMCIRKCFFDRVYHVLTRSAIIHDLALAALAAKDGEFFDLDFVGAFHRRHGENAAGEEHRIIRLLDYEKKLRDLDTSLGIWREFTSPLFDLSEEDLSLAKTRLRLMEERKEALCSKSLVKVARLYLRDRSGLLRVSSFVCDLALVFFGKIFEISGSNRVRYRV